MLAIHNSWVRAEHHITGDLSLLKGFNIKPIDVPNPYIVMRLWRGILATLDSTYGSKLTDDLVRLNIKDITHACGYRTNNFLPYLQHLPWLLNLLVNSDNHDEYGSFKLIERPVISFGYDDMNMQFFRIQLHKEAAKHFGWIEEGSFTKINPIHYKAFRTLGSAQFYERCCSYATMNQPWIADVNLLRELFGVGESSVDLDKSKKYSEWRFFRQLLKKKCDSLAKLELNVKVGKVQPNLRNDLGEIEIIPISVKKIKYNSAIPAVNKTYSVSKVLFSCLSESSQKLYQLIAKAHSSDIVLLAEDILNKQCQYIDNQIVSTTQKGKKVVTESYIIKIFENQCKILTSRSASEAPRKPLINKIEALNSAKLTAAKKLMYNTLDVIAENHVKENAISEKLIDEAVRKENKFSPHEKVIKAIYDSSRRVYLRKISDAETKLYDRLGVSSESEAINCYLPEINEENLTDY